MNWWLNLSRNCYCVNLCFFIKNLVGTWGNRWQLDLCEWNFLDWFNHQWLKQLPKLYDCFSFWLIHSWANVWHILDVYKYMFSEIYLKAIPNNKHVRFFIHSNEVLWWFQTRLHNIQFSVACECFVFPALIFASIYSLLQSKSWF